MVWLFYGGRRKFTRLATKRNEPQNKLLQNPFYKTPKAVALVLACLILAGFFSSFHLAKKHYPDRTCVICHEMKEPVRKWRAAGVAQNHQMRFGQMFYEKILPNPDKPEE